MNINHILKLSKLYSKYAYWNPRGAGAAGILLVCNEDNTIFLTKRSPHVQQPNTWGNQGGAVDPDEDENPNKELENNVENYSGTDMSMNGALREAIEELGSLPTGMRLLAQTTFSDRGFTYKTYIFNISLEEKERWTPGVTLNWENSRAEWFDKNRLPSPLHPGITAIPRLLPESDRDILDLSNYEEPDDFEFEDEGEGEEEEEEEE